MKNMRKLNYIYITAIVVACAGFVGLAPKASALTIGDNQELGFVEFGIPSGDTARTTYVNHLINMTIGTTDSADGQTYTRSNNDFGPLVPAIFAGNGTSTSIDLGAGYLYLFAKYDGPNFGSEVWYVGNLSGIQTIPATAGGYGLSGWTLFNGAQVPDSGSTVAFLGVAFAAAELLRRAVSRRAVKA
jgi:hypothetical protein